LYAAIIAVFAMKGDEGEIDEAFKFFVGDAFRFLLQSGDDVGSSVLNDEFLGKFPEPILCVHEDGKITVFLGIEMKANLSPASQRGLSF